MGLGRQFGQINFRAFGVFSANLSAPIFVLWVLCPCFSLFDHYFYKKISLYIPIPIIYLGLGFEFGPQRIYLGIQSSCIHSPWRISSHLHVRQHDFFTAFQLRSVSTKKYLILATENIDDVYEFLLTYVIRVFLRNRNLLVFSDILELVIESKHFLIYLST